jgi:hypothetical protein
MTSFSGAGRDVIADLVEAVAFCSPGEPLSRSAAQGLCHDHFAVSHDEVTDAFAVLNARRERLNGLYPFDTAATFIVYEGSADSDLYMSLNLVSPQGLAREVRGWALDTSAKLFEFLAEKCLSDFFGQNTETVNFGHPSEVGRPSEFDQAVRWFGARAGIKIGAAYRPPRRKDGGVDIFVWKRFDDSFPGVPLLMVQCTIMKDYLNKIGDIDIPLWSAWLSSDINPLAAIALPTFVTNKAEWDEIATRGIMLDRGRLVSMNAANTVEMPLKYKNYVALVRTHISELIK